MLKSYFLSSWLILLGFALVHSVYLLLTGGWPWTQAVLLVALGTPLVFMTRLYLNKRVSRSEKLPGYTVIIALAFILSVIQNISPTEIVPLVYALSAYLGWMLYLKWYAYLGRQVNPDLAVGKPLPDFVLETPGGQRLPSSVFKQQKAIWIFIRGNWCPLCRAQIHEVAALYRSLSQKKVAVILVSGQSQQQTQALAKRFEVPFTFLIDKDLAVARQLGLYHQYGLPAGLQVLGFDSDTLYPTVLITDQNGVIQFADQSDHYRLRPEPELFLNVVEMMD